MSAALYPGSFDPVHLGHVAIIERASLAFDRVVVAVVANPNKRSGLFSVQERVDLLTASVATLENVTCVTFNGLTVDIARVHQCDAVVRTGHKDELDEWSMLGMNHLMTGARTVFLPPTPGHMALSSSIVRSYIADGDIAGAAALVPPPVAEALMRVGVPD